jgi:hypothetical protein
MIDRIWDFFISDDRVDRLLSRAALMAFMVIIFVIWVNLSVALAVGIIVIIVGAVIFAVVTKRADKKAEEEWKELLKQEDDGVTGYIPVRPEELEAAPWEVRKPKSSKPSKSCPQIENQNESNKGKE